MNKKIENLIDEIEKKQMELVENKKDLMLNEQKLEIETANINCKSKDDWAELNITNGEGRKAFAVKKLEKFKANVNCAKAKLMQSEAQLKVLNKKFDYMMLCYEMEAKQ